LSSSLSRQINLVRPFVLSFLYPAHFNFDFALSLGGVLHSHLSANRCAVAAFAILPHYQVIRVEPRSSSQCLLDFGWRQGFLFDLGHGGRN
jgi:hypothetical protein